MIAVAPTPTPNVESRLQPQVLPPLSTCPLQPLLPPTFASPPLLIFPFQLEWGSNSGGVCGERQAARGQAGKEASCGVEQVPGMQALWGGRCWGSRQKECNWGGSQQGGRGYGHHPGAMCGAYSHQVSRPLGPLPACPQQ